MERLRGRAVTSGIIFGKLVFFDRDEQVVKRRKVSNPGRELEKYEEAKEMAGNELDALYEREIKNIGQDHAEIFLIHRMLLEDDSFVEKIKSAILEESYPADYAVQYAAAVIAGELGRAEDEYIRARTADVKDVSRRLIRHIQNTSEQVLDFGENTILCCFDIEPSEVVRLDRNKVKAICACYGSVNSHAAILSRSIGITTIAALGKGLNEKYNGLPAVVDGYAGILYIDPDDGTYRRMMEKREDEGRKKELLKRLKGRPSKTLDGKVMEVYANISGLIDLKYAEENDAAGVGLFRSEFLYLQNDDFPDEELQFYTYRRALENMHGKKVIIRTLDMGNDKNPDYNSDRGEERNPALGLRSIRLCFSRPIIFRTQLRALYRASVYGDLAILFPLIIDVEEVKAIKGIISDVLEELDEENIPYSKNVQIGIMIETPAAVMLSDELAQEVDFFSFGTNDLEQYTLAIDMQDARLESYCKPHHKAILRMLKMTIENAHLYGKKVCLCGDLGAEIEFTELFLAMGVDCLSIPPTMILNVRKKIRSLKIENQTEVMKKYGVI